MRGQDRPHISPENTRNLSGSAYVDEALEQVVEACERASVGFCHRI